MKSFRSRISPGKGAANGLSAPRPNQVSVRERFNRERNGPPKTKLSFSHERILLTLQRGHVLRSRAQLLVLRSPTRPAGSRPRDHRVSLS